MPSASDKFGLGFNFAKKESSIAMDIEDPIPLNKKKKRSNFVLKLKKEAEARTKKSCF
jgi:hypothetical protein